MKSTSVEAERSFSAAGYFLSKLRTRMGENALNAFCFLRCYFRKKIFLDFLRYFENLLGFFF